MSPRGAQFFAELVPGTTVAKQKQDREDDLSSRKNNKAKVIIIPNLGKRRQRRMTASHVPA